MRLKIKCDWCGKEMQRYPSGVKCHNFCSRGCLAAFSSKKKNPGSYESLKDFTNISKNMSELNRELNPTRMTSSVREKLRESRLGTGEGKTYAKRYGRHEHRIVAEQILGRKLLPGEIVHHVDGNKRNNREDNILILDSQSEHAKLHARERLFWNDEGGEAE